VKINKGKRAAPRRVLLYGVAGVGKSTWAAQAPSPLFLNIEDGVSDIDCDSTSQLTEFNQVVEAINWLVTAESEYKTVVVDSLDWVEKLIHKDIALAAGKETIADIEILESSNFIFITASWKSTVTTSSSVTLGASQHST